ncbi:hypothetical protein ART_2641 [Arthrobacter sp. PAMC 25486]|nr:hypothetical protein ART_2641 [Arthrobacter sp. PAMC 25486]
MAVVVPIFCSRDRDLCWKAALDVYENCSPAECCFDFD